MVATLLHQLAATSGPALRTLALLAAAFTALSLVARPCNTTPPWWRKPGLAADIGYAVLPRLLYSYAQTAMLVLGLTLFYGLTTPEQATDFFRTGHGPLGPLTSWQQALVYLLGLDLMLYWTHRAFHSARLWRFHAVHHASTQLDWVSASRFHPVDHILHIALADTAMLLLGIPPEIVVWLAPFNAGTSALVHANLDWDFGPLRHVLASPVYHRWHHTSAARGGSSNFAATFPLIDRVFGTQYLQHTGRPDRYGVDDPAYPRGVWQQLAYPFQRH